MKTFIIDLLSAAFFSCLLQNIIFTGGFGVTETIRMAAKPKNLTRSAAFITLYSVSVALICRSLDNIAAIKGMNNIQHSLLFYAVLAGVFLITLGAAVLLKASDRLKRRMSVCAFNTLVLSIPFISYKSAFTLAESLGAAIGASAAYVLAAVILHKGMEKLRNNETIPEHFKGNAALLIYTAIISLALAGISGERISL